MSFLRFLAVAVCVVLWWELAIRWPRHTKGEWLAFVAGTILFGFAACVAHS